jgi:capsular polysaccharide biosynthesis protein
MTTAPPNLNGAAPADSPTPTPGRKIDPLGSLKKRWLLAALLFFPVAAASVPAAYLLGKPTYYTEAVVYVSPRFLKNLQDDKEQELQSNSQYREYVQQQVRTINRYDICQETLKRLESKIQWRKPKETEQHAIERLQSELQVKPVLDTYQFTVGMEAERADHLAEIINTVVDVFLEKQKDEEFYAGDLRVDLLRNERKELVAALNEKSARKTAIAQELGVTTFNGNLINPYDDLLVNQRKSLAAARQQRIAAEADFAAVAPNGGRPRPALDALVGDQVSRDSGLNALKSNLFLRRSELVSKMSGLTPDHPGRRAMEREIRDIDAEYERAVAKRSAEFAEIIVEQRRAEQVRAQRVESDVAREVGEQERTAAAFTARYNEALTLNDDIERIRKRLDSVDDRVDQLSLERKAPGFIRVFSPARTPEFPVKGSRKKIFLMVIGAALGLALVVPVGLDFLDPRIQMPGEVEKIAGFAPMGWITVPMDRDSRTLSGEQLSRVALRLAREFRDHDCRTVALVGLIPGGGVAELARALTESLAEAGITACAVSANPFAENGTADGPGVTDVLRGTHTVSALLNGGPLTAVNLPLGGGAEGRHLPNRSRFSDLVAELKTRFDLTLFETPPVLESSDAEFIAGMCDLTVVVVEAWKVEKKDVTEAFRLVERLAPPSVGCVVTGIREAGGARGAAGRKLAVGKWLWK